MSQGTNPLQTDVAGVPVEGSIHLPAAEGVAGMTEAMNSIMAAETLEEAVAVALGAASVCWEPRPTGVFQSDWALLIGQALVARAGGQDA